MSYKDYHNLPENTAAALAKQLDEMKFDRLRAACRSRINEQPEPHVSKNNQRPLTDIPTQKLLPSKSKEQSDDDCITPAEKSLLQKIVRRGLVNNRYDLEIQQKNPNSPLHSVKSFESLHLRRELLKSVYEMGFNAPSKIQETALPTLLADPPQNMIAQSQSGTGKTATFLLTMLSRIDPSQNHPQALCISPTFELAVQIGEQASRMARYCPEITVGLGVRGEGADKELFTNHIIIGTPGKMVDLSVRLKRINLKKVKVFVLDEADIMINSQGFKEQSVRIMKGLSDECQIMLFSATYEHHLMKFAEGIIPDPIIIKLRKEEETLENIKQFYTKAASIEEKFQAIENVYATLTIGQSMVFCQTKKKADQLCEKMRANGFIVGMLTGDLSTEERIKVLDEFRDMNYNSLITTNVLARGIDIETVSLVINFDIPINAKGSTDFETYLHRIGRTGRFGKSGIAINIIESNSDFEKLREIERHFGLKIPELDVHNLGELEKIGHIQ